MITPLNYFHHFNHHHPCLVAQYSIVKVNDKNHEYLSKELLNDSRNIRMIPKIEHLLSQQSNLICVGAAHLSGKSGLIELLRLKGYKVSAVL